MLGRMVEIKDMLGNHQIIRADGRKVDELRPVRITRHFTDAPGQGGISQIHGQHGVGGGGLVQHQPSQWGEHSQ